MTDRDPRWDVAVFLGSSWSRLATHGTRWRAITTAWATDPRVRTLTVVDYPRFGVKRLRRVRRPARSTASWHGSIHAVAADVPLPRRRTPLDEVGWSLVGRSLHELVPDGRRRLAVAATPLWTPVLRHVSATCTAFDAVDDWRSYPDAGRVRARVDDGYRAAAGVDRVTATTREVARRLGTDFGVTAEVFPNGVDLDAYVGDLPARPAGVPDGPYVVYQGVVDDRVDLDLLEAVGDALDEADVVVAGRADGAVAQRLHRSGIVWLGPIPLTEIPALLRHARVGLVPHRINEFTTSMDPMKLLEYLAAGLPVVATPLPDIGAASRRVQVAQGGAAFLASVRRALALEPLGAPDPQIIGRTWTALADGLLTHYLGEAA